MSAVDKIKHLLHGDPNDTCSVPRHTLINLATEIEAHRGPPPDYRRERDNERLLMVAAIIESGFSNQELEPSALSNRAITLARDLITKVHS